MVDRLTRKQQAFAKGFAVHGNATRAAKDAGYAEASASVEGSRQLAKAKVKDYIDQLISETPDDKDINAEVITKRLWQLSLEAKEGGTKAKCLELLGKRLGMFRDVVEDKPQPTKRIIDESYKKLVGTFEDMGLDNPHEAAKKYLLSEGIDIDKLVSIEGGGKE